MEECSEFIVPNEKERKAALGIFGDMRDTKKIYQTIIPFFDPLPEPKEGEWLDENREVGQSFQSYKNSFVNMKKSNSETIYIQPCEKNMNSELLEALVKFTSAYFLGMPVKLCEPINIIASNIELRAHKKYNVQYNATQILKCLEKHLPKDAYCMIGILMSDLYPTESVSYVYGLASLQNRTGVFSFARYSDNFFKSISHKHTDFEILIYKSCKLIVHEIGHMFGLKHCIYYNCIMNGANHLSEANSKPIEMCPICLRKLQSNIKFNLFIRYEKLLEFCKKHEGGFEDWLNFYIRIISGLEPLKERTINSVKELNRAEIVPNFGTSDSKSSNLLAVNHQSSFGLQQYGIPIQYATPRIRSLLEKANKGQISSSK